MGWKRGRRPIGAKPQSSFSAPKKEKTPLCDAQRGFRSLKMKKYIVVGLGILINPLFPKHRLASFYSIIKYPNKNVKMEF
jgi:hypothetical protein